MNTEKFADIYTELMTELGVDWSDPNNKGTPQRVAKYYAEFLNPPAYKFTTFPAEGYDQMIIQDNIPFHSLCAHHHLPFFGYASIGYIPDKEIVGLSKLARTIELFSRELTNQERITEKTAELLWDKLKPKGIIVVLKAKHMCMEMRGVCKHDTWTTTSHLKGAFEEEKARNEFLSLIAK